MERLPVSDVFKRQINEELDKNPIPDTKNVENVYNRYQKVFNIPNEDLRTKSILDVGAGTGKFTRYLRENLGNDTAYAVEKREEKIPADRPEWYVIADGARLPFSDSSFQIVTALGYISMFYSETGGVDETFHLDELLRVLESKGKLYFSAFTQDHYLNLDTKNQPVIEGDQIGNYFKNTDKRNIIGSGAYEQRIKNLEKDGYVVSIINNKKDGNTFEIIKP